MLKRFEFTNIKWGRLASLVLVLMFTLPLTACQLSNRPPTAVIKATPTDGEAPLTVRFDISRSSDPDGKIAWFELYFGDCTLPLTGTDISRPVQHTYQGVGAFAATLTVRDKSGATDEATITITLEGPSPIETLMLGSGSVKVGSTLEIPIILDNVPQGLAGYIMTVFLVTGAVADIEKVTLVTVREAGVVNIASDKKSVTFQAVDFSHAVVPGNSNITLARVAFKGVKKGTSIICAQIDRLDADGGADLLLVTKIEQGSLKITR